MEFGMMARVGTVPLRATLLHCLYHVKERAAMQQAMTRPPGHSSRGYGPHATISANPAGFYEWGHCGGGQGYLLWPLPTGTEHLHMPMPQPLNAGSLQWAGSMGIEGWPLQHCTESPQCGWSAITQAGPYLRAGHIPMPLHGPPPCFELNHHHYRPAGMKAPWPHSSLGTALHVPARPSPQALCRAGSTSPFPQELKGKPLPAYH